MILRHLQTNILSQGGPRRVEFGPIASAPKMRSLSQPPFGSSERPSLRQPSSKIQAPPTATRLIQSAKREPRGSVWAISELRYGKHEQLRRIAQEIIVDQKLPPFVFARYATIPTTSASSIDTQTARARARRPLCSHRSPKSEELPR